MQGHRLVVGGHFPFLTGPWGRLTTTPAEVDSEGEPSARVLIPETSAVRPLLMLPGVPAWLSRAPRQH